jgi:cell wall-associated NlpC family hydrolase
MSISVPPPSRPVIRPTVTGRMPSAPFVLALLLVIGFAILTTGCGSSGAATGGDPSGPYASARATTSAEPGRTPSEARAVESDLRSEATSWEGVPHRWGGTTRRGIDCSGLTQVMYTRVLGLNLPRDTNRQARTGERVRRSALQPGDLVFFRTGRKTRHVGVYLSGGEFVHASSSSGVTISSLNTDYWRRTWWHARRVLSDSDALPPDSAARPSSTTDQPSRAGW